MASNPPPSPSQQQQSLSYPYNLNFQSSTSVAIIIVVLGATFFFMFLFVIYIKRCNTERFDATAGDGMMLAPGGGGGAGSGAAGWNPQQQQRIHGLDPEILHKFPILQFSSLDRSGSKNTSVKKGKIEGPVECAVCLGAFEESELLRILPACGHLFHPDCIDMWLHTHSTCPLCRRSLSRDAVSGHLLQRALAAIASLRGSAPAQEIESSSPENSSPPPPPPAPAPPPPLPRSSANEEELDLEAQQGQEHGYDHDHEHEQILRALSRNSESFKAAAHSLEIQDVREKLLMRGASSSSGRFSSSNPISRSNPSSMRLDCSSPGRFHHSATTTLSPVACGRMIQHSQSFSNLSAGVTAISPGCSLCQHPDHPQDHHPQHRQYRSSSSLRRSRSVSASGAVEETGKRYSS